jgi:tetratricopeptide (TPR) repeat protein
MRSPIRILSVVVLASFLALSSVASAEHPVDVQRLSAEGEHFKALEIYEMLPDRRLGDDTHIAAAKSAWALGLTKKAAELFDSVLRGSSVDNEERARLTLSRGIIELQEGRYQEAALFAEKATCYLPEKSPLRGRALLLWGQGLFRAQAYATSEEKFWRALAESAPEDRPDVSLSLGMAQLKLGKLNDAERALKAIPTDHPNAPEAIRLLAELSLQSGKGDRARFWIDKGRSDYAESFLDSWSDYGLTAAALKSGDLEQARKTTHEAARRLPPSDPWLILTQASLEQAEWSRTDKSKKDKDYVK